MVGIANIEKIQKKLFGILFFTISLKTIIHVDKKNINPAINKKLEDVKCLSLASAPKNVSSAPTIIRIDTVLIPIFKS